MDTSSRMSDPANELTFSKEQGFFDKSPFVKILIGAIFTLSLFLVLHFREVSVEVLEFGSIAPSYIVAQTDFEFYDEEATIIQKQEAVKDVGKIYRISDDEIRSRRLDFEGFLAKDELWRIETDSSFDEMYEGVEALQRTLLSSRFSDPRTLQKLNEMEASTKFYFIFKPGKELGETRFPLAIWKQIQQLIFPKETYSQRAAEYILNYFQEKLWTVVEDIPTERALRKRIQERIPEKMTRVSAGSRILDKGDKVTARHLAILQAMKQALNEKRNLSSPTTILGSLILSALLAGICVTFLYVNYPDVMRSNRKLFLIVTVVIITFGLAKVTESFFLSSKNNLIEVVRYPLFVPFSTILLCSLLNPAIAAFTAAFLTIILMMTLAFDSQGFTIMNLGASLITILSTRTLKQRKEIFIICASAWLCCIGIIISLHLYQNTGWDGLWIDVVSSGGFMLLTAVAVIGMLPLLETSFRIMTDVTLMEYMDPNHDLLRRLSVEAPGTYQHSVVVGNLAETAALAVGANGLFCRVATLYHDVGKVATPQYFTENQHGGMNIHQLLTPQESAQVIIAHVAEGVALARKAGLPEQFIDVIKEHHGTTLVYYFYNKEMEKRGGDKSKVDETEFRYAGPRPRSKESTIIMIADSLEAASRSLDKLDEPSTMRLANRIMRDKADDGQFDESPLTLEELATVKETLVKTIVAYGHSRIKYPQRDLGEETLRDGA